MTDAASAQRSKRTKTWTSSDKRKLTEMFGVRLGSGGLGRLDQEAKRRGFATAQEMVRHDYQHVLEPV